jgi:hypothetical protein
LDRYGKFPSRPQPVGKSAFNYFANLKETPMVKFVHGLKAHEILLQDRRMMGSNPNLLTTIEFCYNVKKRQVIRNEIMLFHKHPYIEEIWEKIKL